MTVTSIVLHVNDTYDLATATSIDVTTQIQTSGKVIYQVGQAWQLRHFWSTLTDASGNTTTTYMGSFRTADTQAPSLDSSSFAPGPDAETQVIIDIEVSDNSGNVVEVADTNAPVFTSFAASSTGQTSVDVSYAVTDDYDTQPLVTVSLYSAGASPTVQEVLLGEGAGFLEKQVATTLSGTLSFSGLSENTSYVAYGCAQDDVPNTSTLNSSAVTTDEAPDTNAPSGGTVSAVADSSEQVTVSWSGFTDDTGVDHYELYQNTADDFENATLHSAPTTSPTVIAALIADTTYHFYVVAVDAAGNKGAPVGSGAVQTQAAATITYDLFSNPNGISGRPDATPYTALYFTVGNYLSGWPADPTSPAVRLLEIWYEGTMIASMIPGDTQELLASNNGEIVVDGYKYIPGGLLSTWANGDAAHKLDVTRVSV